MKGRINSIESLGTLDGPGIRFVVFFQGCKLRCLYCHNPETWDLMGESKEIDSLELADTVAKYKNYFGKDGGVTFSGGEPLLQPEFLKDCLIKMKERDILTCLDTAGVGFGKYEEILRLVDLVILDIKAVEEDEYKKITGQDMSRFYEFLNACIKLKKKLWLRQVIVPGVNDDKDHILKLKKFVDKLENVEKVELLPYKTIGVKKYSTLGLKYRLDGTLDLSEEKLAELQAFLTDSK